MTFLGPGGGGDGDDGDDGSTSTEDDGEEQQALLKKAGFPETEKDQNPVNVAPKVLAAMQKRITKLYEHKDKLEAISTKNQTQTALLS